MNLWMGGSGQAACIQGQAVVGRRGEGMQEVGRLAQPPTRGGAIEGGTGGGRGLAGSRERLNGVPIRPVGCCSACHNDWSFCRSFYPYI